MLVLCEQYVDGRYLLSSSPQCVTHLADTRLSLSHTHTHSETDPGWDKDIRDEVLEECQKYGPVVHLAVDKFSKGNVYVRFAAVDGARAARLVMHGRCVRA